MTLAGECGWDPHTGNVVEVLELSKTHSLIFYTGQGTIVMDNVKDPRHLASGTCKGMGTIDGETATWSGACRYVDAQGGQLAWTWGSRPGAKPGDPDGGWYRGGDDNTGKFAGFKMAGIWTGLPKGGARFCDD
jgi:hypothetical protein